MTLKGTAVGSQKSWTATALEMITLYGLVKPWAISICPSWSFLRVTADFKHFASMPRNLERSMGLKKSFKGLPKGLRAYKA